MFIIRRQPNLFYKFNIKSFTGKTETGWKFTTPKMRMKKVRPIFPPPGMNLELPEWTPEKFCKQIGGDCHEISDKFTKLSEIFESKREELKLKGVPIKQRKYILRTVDLLRRGVLTFEYLNRRTNVKPVRKLSIAKTAPGKKKDDKKAEVKK